MNASIDALVRQFGWQRRGAPVSFQGISTDTRRLQPGELFVALVGERFDGHDYVVSAFAAGAAAALVSRPLAVSGPQLVAPDTLRALGELAALHRSAWPGELIAVTGSAGKTTTKDMLACILGRHGEVAATAGNYNNEIGVPLTLLTLRPEHDYAVIEMGAAKPHDIAYLVGLARPHVSILTNAMPAHLQGFGDLAQVAQTKGEIFGNTGDRVSVINLDDRFAQYWCGRAAGSAIVGCSAAGRPDAALAARQVVLTPDGSEFRLDTDQGSCRVRLQVPGAHNVANALAAAAGALAVGLTLDQVRQGLEQFDGVHGRLQRRTAGAGMLVIDDTYNANPAATMSALEVLAMQAGPRVFIFGDMAELGPEAVRHHREIGACARELGIEQLLAVGEFAAATAAGYGYGARAFASQFELLEWLAREPLALHFKSCLVKGSRSARMERIVNYLVEAAPDAVVEPGAH